MKAARGLNTSTIEDTRTKKKPSQMSRHDISDRSAITSPNFAVTQALVALLAEGQGMGPGKRAAAVVEDPKGKIS